MCQSHEGSLIKQVGFAENETRPKVGAPAFLENWPTLSAGATVGDTTLKAEFQLDKDFGTPGAFIIKNFHKSEFYLKTVTLQNVPGKGKVHFSCYSWVYPADKYKYDRVFFANQVIVSLDFTVRQ